MKKFLIVITALFFFMYAVVCGLLYVNQESILFRPRVLPQHFTYNFSKNTQEIKIDVEGKKLSTVLFKSDSSRGVIFYLHGNGGCLEDWGMVAPFYVNQGYDVFMIDYRGYGKSEGTIESEAKLYNDIDSAYAFLKTKYEEQKIVVLGYSLGTGLASYVASHNKPKMLVLQAPYYSMTDMVAVHYPYVPSFLLKYKLVSLIHLKKCSMPVVIFHGDKDNVIPYDSSVRLSKSMKKEDRFITLHGQGHHGMTDNEEYQKVMIEVLK
jgi:uncharacterized protein